MWTSQRCTLHGTRVSRVSHAPLPARRPLRAPVCCVALPLCGGGWASPLPSAPHTPPLGHDIDYNIFRVYRTHRYSLRPRLVYNDQLRLFESPLYPRAHTLPPRPSTCSACRATAQASSLGSRQLMAGLAGHVARAFRMCSWSPTGHFSGGAHPQLFRKHGDPPFSRRIGQLAPAA